jgi:hypothetical protein
MSRNKVGWMISAPFFALYKWIDQFDPTILKILGVSGGGYGKPLDEGDAAICPSGRLFARPVSLRCSIDFGIGVGDRCGKVEHLLFKCL